MKNKWLVIVGTGILVVTITTVALAASNIKLIVNGREVKPDVPPQLVNGRAMVPVRWVAEALGAQVDWEASTQTVRITTGAPKPGQPATGQPQALPELFQDVAAKLAGVEVPVYVPTWLPGDGPFRVAEFQADKDGYRFKVIRGEEEYPPVVENVPSSEADLVVEVTAANQPFLPYPTEGQLLGQPAGDVDLDGVTARSFGDGMMLTWSAGNWAYTALGHAPGDGVRVAREILRALPGDGYPVPGASQGKFRAAQLGNPMHVTASWTYDGKTWYTLSGRATPEAILKTAESMILLSELETSFPAATASGGSEARTTLVKYFHVLQEVANRRYGGFYSSPEAQEEAFRSPYSFLSSGLQEKYPFDEFRSRLDPVADLQVLQLWAAPGRVDLDATPPGEESFFVELKTVEMLEQKTAVVYYSGYFTLAREGDGWRVTKAEVEPENLAWKLGGHQPWRADPAMVANVELRRVLDAEVNSDPAASRVTRLDDGRVVVMVPTTGEKPEWHKVILVPLTDGTWRVLSWQ